jgi:hypothetical protein
MFDDAEVNLLGIRENPRREQSAWRSQPRISNRTFIIFQYTLVSILIPTNQPSNSGARRFNTGITCDPSQLPLYHRPRICA